MNKILFEETVAKESIVRTALYSFTRFVRFLSWLGAVFSGFLMLGITAYILLEIVLRAFFQASTNVLDEIVGYGVGAMTFMTLAYTLCTNQHIQITLLRDRVSESTRVKLDVAALLFSLATTSVVAWYIGRSAFRAFERGTVSATVARVPLWIPESVFLAGLVLLALAMLVSLLNLLILKKAVNTWTH